MSEIFCVDEHDVEWFDYDQIPGIRVKPLTRGIDTSTDVQYVEYPPDHSDSVHRHDEGEVFLVTDGELWLDDARYGPGSILCIPAEIDYAVRSGPQGARYFRVVIP